MLYALHINASTTSNSKAGLTSFRVADATLHFRCDAKNHLIFVISAPAAAGDEASTNLACSLLEQFVCSNPGLSTASSRATVRKSFAPGLQVALEQQPVWMLQQIVARTSGLCNKESMKMISASVLLSSELCELLLSLPPRHYAPHSGAADGRSRRLALWFLRPICKKSRRVDDVACWESVIAPSSNSKMSGKRCSTHRKAKSLVFGCGCGTKGSARRPAPNPKRLEPLLHSYVMDESSIEPKSGQLHEMLTEAKFAWCSSMCVPQFQMLLLAAKGKNCLRATTVDVHPLPCDSRKSTSSAETLSEFCVFLLRSPLVIRLKASFSMPFSDSSSRHVEIASELAAAAQPWVHPLELVMSFLSRRHSKDAVCPPNKSCVGVPSATKKCARTARH